MRSRWSAVLPPIRRSPPSAIGSRRCDRDRQQLAAGAGAGRIWSRVAEYIGGIRPEPARPSWQALAAAVVLAAAITGAASWFMLRPNPAEASAELVVASHMRAMMAPQPTDVSSSDRHTVKPWFNGRIPQAPRVVDLTDKGFPLVGGRIDVVGRAPVPTLVYRHRQHLISLIAVPVASGARAERTPDDRRIQCVELARRRHALLGRVRSRHHRSRSVCRGVPRSRLRSLMGRAR